MTNLLIGQYADVVANSESMLELGSNLPDVHMLQGFAYCNLNQLAEAEVAYSRGLEIDPDHVLLHLLRADVRRQQDNLVLALVDLRFVRESDFADAFEPLTVDAEPVTCHNCFDLIRSDGLPG